MKSQGKPKVMSKLKKPLQQKVRAPVWTGPGGEGPQGGVTQGMIARWLTCRERFRARVIEGLKPADRFEPRVEYGNMWHACEEAAASEVRHFKGELSGTDTTLWSDKLTECVQKLCRKYPMQQQEIVDWADKCRAMFPLYVKHWSEHPDVQNRTPLFQEHAFDVPIQLPSGRTARLRGKWDSVDLVGNGTAWLQENKSKSSVDDVKVAQQLTCDLQTMTYCVALTDHLKTVGRQPIKLAGVRYNVVRRPAHKSVASMLEKFGVDSRNGRVGEWFARWNVLVQPTDTERFRQECLTPILENMCDDWEWWDWSRHVKDSLWNPAIRACQFPKHQSRHFRVPYYYSPLSEGGSGDLDNWLNTGSEVGLQRTKNLFPELQEDDA